MSLEGGAFLAIWNDVQAGAEAEYDLWHSREHVPERVGVPGILEGRRYVASKGLSPVYFTLYDLTSADVLASAPYRELVREPSPWSLRMRPVFRNLGREPCRIVARKGAGTGGAIATVRFERDGGAGRIPAAAMEPALARIRGNFSIASLLLGEVLPSEAHPIADAEIQNWAGGVRYVLLAEGTSAIALAEGLDSIANTLVADWGVREPIIARVYGLALIVRHPGSGPRRAPQPNSTNTG